MNLSRCLAALLATSYLLFPVYTLAEEADGEQITNLDQLLETVREQQSSQQALNAQREQEFLKDKQQQEALLTEAKRAFESSQRSNQPLLAGTEANAAEIARLEKRLEEQVQSMGDISATFREFAGDFAAVMKESMVTVQLPDRAESLQRLADADSQPTIKEIQTLWLLLQQEMTAAGQITRFDAPVVAVDGTASTVPVVRIGTFSALSENGFLRYIPETGELLSLSRQPASRYLNPARQFVDSKTNEGKTKGSETNEGKASVATAVIDPSRGSLLGMIGYMPGPQERIEQGGPIARIILVLGALGMLLTGWRTAYLGIVHLRVRRQLRDIGRPLPSNPLGRVMMAASSVSGSDEKLLLMKLDEAILTEVPALERWSSLIKLLAAIAPLLGLLGTVTGMIVTFQAISLYGTGDPKLMAGGISQALVTTVLGLIVAIPLLFGHSLVASLSRSLVQRLDEQSAGVLARSVERREKE